MKRSKEEIRERLLEEADDMFGNNPTYWYGLLSIAFEADNQRVAEEIIERCQQAAKRSHTPTPRGER